MSRASTAVLAAAASVMATAVIVEDAVARVYRRFDHMDRRMDDLEVSLVAEMRETAAAALSVPRPRATSSAADVVPAAEL